MSILEVAEDVAEHHNLVNRLDAPLPVADELLDEALTERRLRR